MAYNNGNQATINGMVVRVDDCVALRSPGPGDEPYIGKVKKIEASRGRNHYNLEVQWYYRPEDTRGGRRLFHGANELFLSDHMDTQSSCTVERKCIVHSFKNYTELPSIGPDDYFSRFHYNSSTGVFTPDRVTVFCSCEMPYNPDVLMVQCEGCDDWFHPECVGLTPQQVEEMDHFSCTDCRATDD